MANPIFHSQYTAAQIEAAIGKGPRVNSSGFWEVWNVANMAYESTGVGAGVTPPTVVTQVSQMTNHGYIYIYNGSESGYTAGYWYYWNGSAWTAGGAYQVAATDPTLSVSGGVADAKATGNAINDVNAQVKALEIKNQLSVTWEQGYIRTTDGSALASNNWVRTKYYLAYPGGGGLYVTVPAGYRAYACVFNGQSVSSFVGKYRDTTYTADFVVEAVLGQYVKVVYGNADGSQLSPSGLSGNYLYAIRMTDTSLTFANKAADAGAVRSLIDFVDEELTNNLFGNYTKSYPIVSWESGGISSTGAEEASTTQIRTGYNPSLSGYAVEISPTSGVECSVHIYSAQSVSAYQGCPFGFVDHAQRYNIPKGYSFRVVARKADGSSISASDGNGILIFWYVNQLLTEVGANANDLRQTTSGKYRMGQWEQGSISYASGSPIDSSLNIRTQYIRSSSDMSCVVNLPDGMEVQITEYSSQSVSAFVGLVTDGYLGGRVRFLVPNGHYYRVVAKFADNTQIIPDDGENIDIIQYAAKPVVNILVVGNSFSMDSFAYLPPVLTELIPDYDFNFGVAYQGSSELPDHITMYNNNTKYTLYYEWSHQKHRWVHYTSTGTIDNGKTLSDIMALRDWNIIYVQPAAQVTSQAAIKSDIIDAGRKLLHILQSLSSVPFIYLMGEWMGTDVDGDHGDAVFELIAAGMQQASKSLGISGYIPIGAAIQNARSNSVLQALGDGGNLLCSDGIHMQSGIAPLLAAYTITMFIGGVIGQDVSVYNSTFEPTTANCIAINAYHTGNPTPMTHGESVGVTAENIRAAQEIATQAMKYPNEIIDCSEVLL